MLSLLELLLLCAILTSAAGRPSVFTLDHSVTDILGAQTTAIPSSPISNVEGVSFNRIVHIWLENTDYEMAAGDPNMKNLAKKAITLSNFWAVTHPSMPNYVAAVGGDHFGIDHDDFIRIPSNVSTVVDLLDTKSISFGEYHESAPYADFEGSGFSNQQSNSNDYVRKHNPLVNFDSITSNASRLSTLKNFTSLQLDIATHTLPQWVFIVPNMTNDGHDTSVSKAAQWLFDFITPLLSNEHFLNDTLVVLSFDENETYPQSNRIHTLLMGGAVPESLHNTEDDTFYNHYSLLSTVQENWGLPSLGRWDCGANILSLVADKTGHKNAIVDTSSFLFNTSYPGPLSKNSYDPFWPLPNTISLCRGRGVLESVVNVWGKQSGSHNYDSAYPYNKDSTLDEVEIMLEIRDLESTPTASSTSRPSLTASSSATPTTKNLGSESSSSLAFVIAFAVLAGICM